MTETTTGSKPRTITLSNTLAWIWFVLAGLVALVNLVPNPLASVFFAASALVSYPTARRYVYKETNIQLSKYLTAVLVIALWFIGSLFYSYL